MTPDKKTVLVMGIFVAAVFILATTLLRPVTVNVLFEGSGPAAAAIPGVYTLADCVLLSVAAFLLGVTAIILIQSGLRVPLDRNMINPGSDPEIASDTYPQLQNPIEETDPGHLTMDEPEAFLNLLKGNERLVAETLMKYGEMNQADLSARTGIPKSTLSRTLQNLEERKLIFRYDNGMSKMVKLEIHR